MAPASIDRAWHQRPARRLPALLALALVLGAGTALPHGVAAREVEVIVRSRSPYGYEEESVQPLVLGGRSGRYLGFRGRTLVITAASPGRFVGGSPGRCRCEDEERPARWSENRPGERRPGDRRLRCDLVGGMPPTWIPGQPERRTVMRFTYQLDCIDRTFNRVNDGTWLFRPGWMAMDQDPTAAAVAERYCPGLASGGL